MAHSIRQEICCQIAERLDEHNLLAAMEITNTAILGRYGCPAALLAEIRDDLIERLSRELLIPLDRRDKRDAAFALIICSDILKIKHQKITFRHIATILESLMPKNEIRNFFIQESKKEESFDASFPNCNN